MKLKRTKRRFRARRLGHGGAIGLPQLVGLNPVLVKKEHVDGVVHHNDAHGVDIAGLQKPEVNGGARTVVHIEGWRKTLGRCGCTGGGVSSAVGVDGKRSEQEKYDQTPRRGPTHALPISVLVFNDWV